MAGGTPRKARGQLDLGGPWAPSLTRLCFFSVQFHYENTRAQFFVEDASTASALKAVNYKILDQENRRVCLKGLACLGVGLSRAFPPSPAQAFLEFTLLSPSRLQISIIINSSAPPHSVQNELKPEQVEQLKVRQAPVTRFHSGPPTSPIPSPPHSTSDPPPLFLALQLIMSKRYDGSQQALDLKGLRSDPGRASSRHPQGGGGRGGSVGWGGSASGLVRAPAWKESFSDLPFLPLCFLETWWPRTSMLS